MKLRCLTIPLALAGALGCSARQQGPSSVEDQVAATAPPVDLGPLLAHNLLKNSSFDDGKSLPWLTSFSAPAEGEAVVRSSALCLAIKQPGKNPWDAQVRHREMTIQKGHAYRVVFKAWADKPTTIRPKIGQSGPPYSEYWFESIELGSEPRQFVYDFSMGEPDDATAEFAFHVGGPLVTGGGPVTICLDEIVLSDPTFTPPPAQPAPPPPNVAVNQLGYLPGLTKLATVRNAATTPLAWELIDAAGKPVASGTTRVLGQDAPSGDHLHLLDFSTFSAPGKDYRLKVGNDLSHPFEIGGRIYRDLKYDALWYFYHNRSGIPIELPYAGDAQWTRPAGHVGDVKVPCREGIGCNYTLDVSGGWYDAGDHGKYVVNSGISVWTLLDLHERTRYLGRSSADFADGKLRIPEHANRVPDLLDEARWNIAWMLKMQVPDGQPRAGMAHHKIHGKEWTGIGLRPDEDKVPRFLHAPSTAATLNLAAVGAMCARIYEQFDAAFAAQCLSAAEKAWAAARANPAIFASKSDSTGGGPYDDDKVDDEFYWAAAELFITTAKPEYKDFVLKSPYHAAVVTDTGGGFTSMTWQRTDTLGKISLAVVPNKLGNVAPLRQQLQAAADTYLKLIEENGYRAPFKGAGAEGRYPWGSNSFVLNNALVMALAYDFSKDARYLNGVQIGMDYLLGRNPLGQSYVTGYGENPLRNPHHRFWAQQASAKFPPAPPGAVSGGPNSEIQDPYAKAAGLKGCPAQRCFVDHIEAWSVNEITINWNAPLAWVTSFLDEHGESKPKAKAAAAKPGSAEPAVAKAAAPKK